jgi:tetratricopeptide (TPR) repeat protein
VSRLSRWLPAALVGVGLASAPAPGRADALDDLARTLQRVDTEAQELGQGIKKPSGAKKTDAMARRLIDAQVEFGTGNFEGAAILLYDYVNQKKKGRDHDTALYYLGESLFQKGDRVAARTYFTELVKDHGTASRFYQQSLERLIELSLLLRDTTDVDGWLAALDAVPADKRTPSVPYVRGKYAFSLDKYDEAVAFFKSVPGDSEYGLQAAYFLGVSYTALGDLGAATKAMAALIKREPRNDDEARVVELAQMALGRLYYERDQPTKAIDSYLLVDRKSDLFPDALYEVAWVYVKARQYDKALRALELLALADPTSAKLPTVKILEGNLRIRKAQKLKDQEVMGVGQGRGNPVEEYLKADRTFADTRGTYKQPHDELTAIIAADQDPRDFMLQITGRVSQTFEVAATMPEIAAAWIRDEPDVERIVAVEADLGDIQANIAEAERTVDRLDAALTSNNRFNVFPTLAKKRNRAIELVEELFTLRTQLANHQRAIARKHASGAELAELDKQLAKRQKLAKLLAELPHAEVAYGERIERARAEYDEVERRAAELQSVIDSSDATMVALRKYVNEVDPPPAAELKQRVDQEIRELTVEVEQMRAELAEIRREIVVGRDAAGTGDEVAVRGRQLREQLRDAFDAEHKAMTKIMARESGKDRARADRIGKLSKQADATTARLDKMNGTIEQIVEAALADVRDTLAREKAELASYRQEFLLYEAESRDLGGTVLAAAFRDVKAKFYDVLIRSDVGIVDVSWSQKEGADEDLRRLELDKVRELRLLEEDFRDLLDEERESKQAGEPEAAPGGGGGSPDRTAP